MTTSSIPPAPPLGRGHALAAFAIFLVLITVKSAADLDAEEGQGKQFEEALGAEGMKKMAELESACVESSQTNLFVIDPKMSYPPEAMVKADPDFWKPASK